MYKFKALLDGKLFDNNRILEIINPVDFSVAGQVVSLTKQDINDAFLAAKSSQKAWENTDLEKRISILDKWKQLIDQNKEELAQIIMSETAKPYKDCLTEVIRSVEYIDQTFYEVRNLKTLIIDGTKYGAKNKIGTFMRVAKGVGVAISPFNYPINLAVSKIFPCLVTGNTIVFKPATQGSLIGAKLGELAYQANLPKGIFNVVTGRGREIGDDIITNKLADFISFTGSVEVGKRLLEISSTKDVVLELGGKDPAIVLDDLDLEKYAKEIISGAFSYSGQRCTAIKRVITTDKIADQLVPLLKEKINKLTVGLPKDNCDITPLIDQKTADFVYGLIDDAKNKGAKIIIGDKQEKNLIYPTLVDHVTSDMRLAWEEPFGPVLPIIRTNNVDKMIELANKSNFGLQASVYTKNLDQALTVAQKLEVGTVNINGKSQRGPDVFPFLGVKDSGFGVQGIVDTLLFSTRYKGIVINN
ncbi:NADP-dependent glyceraldehyde-3-phosphate dehydrogenase [Mycoplasma mycoides]|uniref:NADP-dependent glyceraldehyde-3-phosphate dehydrogenase n=1 Tax=Mycoplasma mycoides TaxID=2102 RepID=UPI00223FE9E2|nr:NADP-dependent glyceraldehyde-3-phosphate dehydrogenase [Mycoplasma mycoides]QVJ95108.1 NADP-dependent glyceraldehyde-3-phosphate dehydrogenase [Mycoplasma mycoides subsp. capri]